MYKEYINAYSPRSMQDIFQEYNKKYKLEQEYNPAFVATLELEFYKKEIEGTRLESHLAYFEYWRTVRYPKRTKYAKRDLEMYDRYVSEKISIRALALEYDLKYSKAYSIITVLRRAYSTITPQLQHHELWEKRRKYFAEEIAPWLRIQDGSIKEFGGSLDTWNKYATLQQIAHSISEAI